MSGVQIPPGAPSLHSSRPDDLVNCPQDSFGTGFQPVLFSAPRPVSFFSRLLLPFLDEHSPHPVFLSKILPAIRLQSRLPRNAFLAGGASLSTLNCRLSTAF